MTKRKTTPADEPSTMPPAPPPSSASDFGMFEGTPIMSQAVALTKAGDGLSAALAVSPGIELHLGATVYFAVEGIVESVGFEEVLDKGEPTGFLRRKIRVAVSRAAPVNKSTISASLRKTQEAIEKARGVEPLPGLGADDDES